MTKWIKKQLFNYNISTQVVVAKATLIVYDFSYGNIARLYQNSTSGLVLQFLLIALRHFLLEQVHQIKIM